LIDADVALDLTEAVYGELVTDGAFASANAALAVHRAVHRLRAAGTDRPSRWALFTHTGP
jgi:hypothetical protein